MIVMNKLEGRLVGPKDCTRYPGVPVRRSATNVRRVVRERERDDLLWLASSVAYIQYVYLKEGR